MAASLGPNSRGEGELIFSCLGLKKVPLGDSRAAHKSFAAQLIEQLHFRERQGASRR